MTCFVSVKKKKKKATRRTSLAWKGSNRENAVLRHTIAASVSGQLSRSTVHSKEASRRMDGPDQPYSTQAPALLLHVRNLSLSQPSDTEDQRPRWAAIRVVIPVRSRWGERGGQDVSASTYRSGAHHETAFYPVKRLGKKDTLLCYLQQWPSSSLFYFFSFFKSLFIKLAIFNYWPRHFGWFSCLVRVEGSMDGSIIRTQNAPKLSQHLCLWEVEKMWDSFSARCELGTAFVVLLPFKIEKFMLF